MQKKASMVKRCIVVLLAMVILSSALPAQGSELAYLDKPEQIRYAVACLTEVYGYLSDETETFVYEQTCQDGVATLRYWPETQPDWVYTCTFSLTSGEKLSAASPFYSTHTGYPGENSVRFFLRSLVDQQLLSRWDKSAREAFRSLLEQENIKPNAFLDKGLYNAAYTPQRALLDFFVTCYGEPPFWPKAVGQWYEQLLSDHQLEKPVKPALEPHVTRYNIETPPSYVLTEFTFMTPPELTETFEHPMLEEWEIISGAYVTYQEGSVHMRTQIDMGLVAFSKGDEQLLCTISKQPGDEAWHIDPVSTTVIPAGAKPIILRYGPLYTGLSNGYLITYDSEQYKDVMMQVHIERRDEEKLFCKLRQCNFTDAETGDRYELSCVFGDLDVTRSLFKTGCLEHKEMYFPYSTSVTYIDALEIPKFAMAFFENPSKTEVLHLPEDTIITGGVHLRKETSSRSKDLGMINAGTLAKNLGTEPGDPYPWYHVQIGNQTGYIAGNYVDERTGIYTDACLPVAISLKDVGLKEHTGLFSQEVAQIPAGTTMHVTLQNGEWMYVCVPQKQPAGMRMDTDGTYGWIHMDSVMVGSTALSLEWKLAEEEGGQ